MSALTDTHLVGALAVGEFFRMSAVSMRAYMQGRCTQAWRAPACMHRCRAHACMHGVSMHAAAAALRPFMPRCTSRCISFHMRVVCTLHFRAGCVSSSHLISELTPCVEHRMQRPVLWACVSPGLLYAFIPFTWADATSLYRACCQAVTPWQVHF